MSSCSPTDLQPAPAPPAALALFGDGLPSAVRLVELLTTEGITRGLLGPRERERIWERHVLQGAALAQLLPTDRPVLDVGSGAGLPGLAVAIARPDLTVVLLDAAIRRVTFLAEAVDVLGLAPRVSVRRGRLEELPRGERFPVLTARAVAPLPRLVAWCRPRLEPAGRLFAVIGAESRDEALALGAQVHVCADHLVEPLTVAELGRR